MFFACLGALFLILPGCATTTGPKVTSLEVQQAKERLESKAIRHRYDQVQRISDIGYRLIRNLPPEDRSKSYPFLGIKAAKITKALARAYDLPGVDGVAVVTVVKDSPAERAGLQVGDVIVRIDDRKISDLSSFQYATSSTRLKDQASLGIAVNRRGQDMVFTCEPEIVWRKIVFDMIDQQEVNAGAGSDIIMATYGLMKFAESDDEIAVILGHELAHITKGHITKSMGVEMLVGIAAIGIGIISDQLAPGSGTDVIRAASGVGQVFGRSYSRDLEREADYFGLKYTKLAGYDYETASGVWERFAVEIPQSMVKNFLSTHPTSPERMVRIDKIIEELRAED